MGKSQIGRLSERERPRMRKIFDTVFRLMPIGPQREADDELKGIRRARRSGGRPV